MKKLFIFLTMLVVGIVSSWADGFKVSTTQSENAEYQYKIFCRGASSYFLGSTTNSTQDSKEYGLFAFFAADDYTNGYYIYSISEKKWVSYESAESYTDGQNKITMVDDNPSPWNVATDNTDSKYFDIRPFKTDKSVADQSWNWHGGASGNTDNTMGFYSYTDENSGWGLIYSGGSASYFDRKVVALYNHVTNNDEYPAKASGTNLIVSNITNDTPQYFILLDNGTDSNSGEPIYNIMKAEADGYYLNTGQPSENTFSNTSQSNYLFLNSSCQYKSFYEGKLKDGHALASSPNFNFLAKNANYRSLHSTCDGKTLNGWSDNANSNYKIQFYYAAKGSWNGLWAVKVQDYSVWKVIVTGPADGSVTYKGSSLISGATDEQSNNGYYALSTTPSADDFEPTIIDGYCTDISVSLDNNFKEIKVEYTRYDNVEAYLMGQTVLDVTPKGLGYPTENARARLKNAIDVFKDESTTSNLTELITAYTSFFTNNVLPEGKVYTIQSYIKSPSTTTYLKNENGTLTIGAAASATTLNNLWIVRKSGNNYVLQSAADPTKYIVYSSFTLAATGSAWTLGHGTDWPYISMYNNSLGGGRYVACNGSNQFGTAGGSNYYASSTTQSLGWSTDFKFVESEDYALYKVKIIYPSGNTPTVTYNETAYSNGADFVARTTLTVSDLTVSEIEGYTANVEIVGDVIYVNYNATLNATYADTWNFDNYPWLLLNDAPARIANPARTYRYNTKMINVTTTFTSSVVVKFAFTTGSYRIDVAGVDLLDPSTGKVVRSDYHDGFSGNDQSKREYTLNNVAPSKYILRYISYDQSTSSAGNISVLVTPNEGFYRIKSCNNNRYAKAVDNNYSSGTVQMQTSDGDPKVDNIFYLSEKKLLSYSKGLYITNTRDMAAVGVDGDTFEFIESDQNGKYYIKCGTNYMYGYNTGHSSVAKLDRISTTSSYEQQCRWIFEEPVSLPVTFNSAALGYATFYTPVPLQIPAELNTKAYICKVGEKVVNENNVYTLTFYEIKNITTKDSKDNDVPTIPASTPVLLYNSDVSTIPVTVNFPITSFESVIDPDFYEGSYGTLAAETFDPNDTNRDIYSLRVNTINETKKVGFYKKVSGTSLGGFKMFLQTGHQSEARTFTIYFDGESAPTGIVEALGLENDNVDIYDLNGRKLSSYRKGINIVNGKKVMVQ